MWVKTVNKGVLSLSSGCSLSYACIHTQKSLFRNGHRKCTAQETAATWTLLINPGQRWASKHLLRNHQNASDHIHIPLQITWIWNRDGTHIPAFYMHEFISVLTRISEQKMRIYPMQTLEQFKAVAAQTAVQSSVQNSSWANVLQPPVLIIENTYTQCLYFFKERKKGAWKSGCCSEIEAREKKREKKRKKGKKKKKKRKFYQKVSSIASSRSRGHCLWNQWLGLTLTRLNTDPSCKTKAQSWGCEESLWRHSSWLHPSSSVITPDICLWETTNNLLCPILQSVFPLSSTPCES